MVSVDRGRLVMSGRLPIAEAKRMQGRCISILELEQAVLDIFLVVLPIIESQPTTHNPTPIIPPLPQTILTLRH